MGCDLVLFWAGLRCRILRLSMQAENGQAFCLGFEISSKFRLCGKIVGFGIGGVQLRVSRSRAWGFDGVSWFG